MELGQAIIEQLRTAYASRIVVVIFHRVRNARPRVRYFTSSSDPNHATAGDMQRQHGPLPSQPNVMVRAAQASPDSVLLSGAYGDFQKSESAPKGYTT